jgi:molybdopterin molybdotransferase
MFLLAFCIAGTSRPDKIEILSGFGKQKSLFWQSRSQSEEHSRRMDLISVTEADALIRAHVPRLPDEEVPLGTAVGRLLRRPALAERDQPPFDRVTMDGIALASRDHSRGVREFDIAGVQAAGQPRISLPGEGGCIEVMTGAVLPAGCDCVIPVENLDSRDNKARLLESALIEPGRFVHKAGSDHPAGTELLSPGCRIDAPAIAVLASCGLQRVVVAARPRICVIATGDELVIGDAIPEAHQIRSSNAPAIAAALLSHGFGKAQVLHLPDSRELLETSISQALDDHDLLILSGGVSRGRFDFVPEVLASLDVGQHFHRVSQRPGKPMWFGTRARDGRAVFGLPGNPVSSLVCLHRYVIPALVHASGGEHPRLSVRLGEALSLSASLSWFVPVTLDSLEGSLVATPRLINTSGDFAALAGTDGFIALPGDKSSFPKGFSAAFYSWNCSCA